MRLMYCYIEPWIVNQNVYFINGLENQAIVHNKIPLDDVPAYLATCYQNKECDKILLHGSSYGLTQQVASDIVNYGLTNFGLNDMNIEVIKS